MRKERFGRRMYLKRRYLLTGRYQELEQLSEMIRTWIRTERETLDGEWDGLVRQARAFGFLAKPKRRARGRQAVYA